jgi:hypothetical protein
VPINVKIETRFQTGNQTRAEIDIYASGLNNWGSNRPLAANGLIAKGERLRITLKKTEARYTFVNSRGQTEISIAREDAADARRSAAASFDNASVMKLGAALFAVTSINTGSTEEEDMVVRLICTRSGRAPSIGYEYDELRDGVSDNELFIKALTKIEIAKYETLSPCHSVDFSIKGRVWRRISGRQERYGTNERRGFPSSDNGLKNRTSMFLVKYKERGGNFQYVKGIFALKRAADVDNFVYFRFYSGFADAKHWEFEIEPVQDSLAEFRSRNLGDAQGRLRFFYLENSGNAGRINLDDGTESFISFTGKTRISSTGLPPSNRSPRLTNEWDLFSNTSDTQLQMSFDQGPEFTVVAVTEQIRARFSNFPGLYQDVSLMGFNMYSGRTVQDLRSLSVFVERGRRSRLLRTSGEVNGIEWGSPGFEYLPNSKVVASSALVKGTSYYITEIGSTNWQEAGLPTGTAAAVGEVFVAKGPVGGTGKARAGGFPNTAPDIFLDTLLDANDGIGKYAGDLFSIDLEQLSRSKH